MRPRDWLSRFAARGDRIAADLESLVLQESPSEDAERVSSLAQWVRDRLRGCGIRAETRPCAERGDALFAHIGTGNGGTLILGHLQKKANHGVPHRFSEMCRHPEIDHRELRVVMICDVHLFPHRFRF